MNNICTQFLDFTTHRTLLSQVHKTAVKSWLPKVRELRMKGEDSFEVNDIPLCYKRESLKLFGKVVED
jgi:hypothetical protein